MQKILIADESSITQHILATEYIKAGYVVRTVSTINEYFNALRNDDFDLLILDVYFCASNPFELIKKAKETTAGIKVIITAASFSVPEIVEYIKIGASDCVVKPFKVENLLKKTKALFDEEKTRSLMENVDAKSVAGQIHVIEENNSIIKEIQQTVEKIKDYKISVLFSGETGTGKTYYARQIHNKGKFCDEPFLIFDCSSIDAEQMAAELFGLKILDYQTGSKEIRKGKLELSESGTLLIKDIDKMPLSTQARLAMALEDQVFQRENDTAMCPVKARIAATTTRSPEHCTANGALRKDLFYLLNEARIDIPPLRLCKDRLSALTVNMVHQLDAQMHLGIPRMLDDYMLRLYDYDWPGNISELQRVIKVSYVLGQGKEMNVSSLPLRILQSHSMKMDKISDSDRFDLKDYLRNKEIEVILSAMKKFDGNKIKTAQYLGISERSLRYKIKDIIDDA